MSFIRKIRRGRCTYYAEVENHWVNGTVKQVHIRYVGTSRTSTPKQTFPVDPLHAGTLAIGLMERSLAPKDIFDLLEAQGIPHTKTALQKIGIFYEFPGKKVSICLYPVPRSRSAPGARSAPRSPASRRPGPGPSSRSGGRPRSASPPGSAGRTRPRS